MSSTSWRRFVLTVCAIALCSSVAAAAKKKRKQAKPKAKPYNYDDSKYKAYHALDSEEHHFRFDENAEPLKPAPASKSRRHKADVAAAGTAVPAAGGEQAPVTAAKFPSPVGGPETAQGAPNPAPGAPPAAGAPVGGAPIDANANPASAPAQPPPTAQ